MLHEYVDCLTTLSKQFYEALYNVHHLYHSLQPMIHRSWYPVYTHAHTHTHVNTLCNQYTYICMYTCTHTHIHTHVHTERHIHRKRHTHTHTYTIIHAQTQFDNLFGYEINACIRSLIYFIGRMHNCMTGN